MVIQNKALIFANKQLIMLIIFANKSKLTSLSHKHTHTLFDDMILHFLFWHLSLFLQLSFACVHSLWLVLILSLTVICQMFWSLSWSSERILAFMLALGFTIGNQDRTLGVFCCWLAVRYFEFRPIKSGSWGNLDPPRAFMVYMNLTSGHRCVCLVKTSQT